MRESAVDAKPAKDFRPATGFDFLLPLYDGITLFLGALPARRVLLDFVELKPGQRVLDIGCGTGTLAILLKQLHPQIEVVGLDPDPKALAYARKKAQRAGVSPQFDQGYSNDLGYPNDSFHHVFSSFMFHHLEGEQKGATLNGVRRVLKPGGDLVLVDFAGPDAGDSLLSRWFHTREHLKDSSESHILALMNDSGLAGAKIARRNAMIFGIAHITYYLGSRPLPDRVLSS